MKKNILKIFIALTFLAFVEPSSEGMFFDGVDDFIILPNTNKINSTTTNNRTYETYFKAVDVSGGKQIIMKEGGGTRAVIAYIEDSYLILGAYNRADYNPRWEGTFYRTPITDATWYHFALVFDNAQPGNAATNPMNVTSNNALKFYLNGDLVADFAGFQLGGHNSFRLGYKNESLRFPNCGAWTTTGVGSTEYCFGSVANDGGGNEYYFNGNLWGFRIWNGVRTETEIEDNMEIIITTTGTDNLVGVLDGDTFSYVRSDDSIGEETNNNTDEIVWSATAATTNWNTGSNWVNGVVPTENQDAVIQASTNYPLIASHVIIGDVTLNASAEINVSSGGTFDVKYDLINNGTVNVSNEASLTLRKSDGTIGSGDFNITKNSPTYASAYFYSYWSSPTVSTNPATTFPSNPVVYYFDAANEDSDWVANSGNFSPATGYAIRHETAGSYSATFTGTPNTGDVVVDVYDTSNLEGEGSDEIEWSTSGDNLVGNPYASAIDWGLVVTDPANSNIDGTIYLWNQNTAENGENNVSDYVSYNGTGGSTPGIDGKIASGQGFIVKTTGNGSLTFRPTHQVVANNTQFYKSNEKKVTSKKQGRSWFSFNKGDKKNTLLVGFLKGATNKYDRLFDAPFDVNQKSLGFYSLIEDTKKATIQGLPLLTENEKIVPLGFVVDEIGEYTIQLQKEYVDGYNIYLEDKETNVFTDLKKQSYTFLVDIVGENNSRFRIIYTKERKKTLSIDNLLFDTKDFLVYTNSSKELVVKYLNSEEIEKITLYTILGREVRVFSPNQNKSIANLPTGIYVVNAKLKANKTITKKLLIAN